MVLGIGNFGNFIDSLGRTGQPAEKPTTKTAVMVVANLLFFIFTFSFFFLIKFFFHCRKKNLSSSRLQASSSGRCTGTSTGNWMLAGGVAGWGACRFFVAGRLSWVAGLVRGPPALQVHVSWSLGNCI